MAQTSKTECHIVDMISEPFFLNVHFIFIPSACMCVAFEDSNPYVKSHILMAILFTHSTTTSLNILQKVRPRWYDSRIKNNVDCK